MQKLTTRGIESAKADPSGKDIYLRDGDGLELRILPTGKKVWQFRFTFDGKRRILGFGDYTFCSLRDARLRAQDARKCLSLGQNPANEIKTKATNNITPTPYPVNLHPANTDEPDTTHRLVDLMSAYEQWKRDSGKLAYADDVQKNTRLYLVRHAPELAHKLACECDSEDIATLIRPIHERGNIRSAGKLRTMLAAAFQAALQAPYHPAMPKTMLGFNVKTNPVLALPAIHTEPRERFLTQDELGRYGAAVLAGEGITYWCLALSLFAGGQRPLQVARIRDEDYSKDEGLLLLRDPKGKRRSARPHYLPLGPVARDLIKRWLKHTPGVNHPVWFSVDGKQFMESTSLSHQCTRIRKKVGIDHFQLRDIRRTIETEMARIQFSKDIRAHLLSHGLSGIQERHYDRYDRLQEKREALEKWEAHLLALIAPFQNKEVT